MYIFCPHHLITLPIGQEVFRMDTFDIFLQGKGIPRIALIKLAPDSFVRDIVTEASKHGLQLAENEEPLVWIEEAEEPLRLDLSLADAGIKRHSRVHVHTCHRIEVSVSYNGQSRMRIFPPSATIGKVKNWAVHEFDLSKADAVEHALQLTGTTEQPSEDAHIGTLVDFPHCSLSFYLVPKTRVQG